MSAAASTLAFLALAVACGVGGVTCLWPLIARERDRAE